MAEKMRQNIETADDAWNYLEDISEEGTTRAYLSKVYQVVKIYKGEDKIEVLIPHYKSSPNRKYRISFVLKCDDEGNVRLDSKSKCEFSQGSFGKNVGLEIREIPMILQLLEPIKLDREDTDEIDGDAVLRAEKIATIPYECPLTEITNGEFRCHGVSFVGGQQLSTVITTMPDHSWKITISEFGPQEKIFRINQGGIPFGGTSPEDVKKMDKVISSFTWTLDAKVENGGMDLGTPEPLDEGISWQ